MKAINIKYLSLLAMTASMLALTACGGGSKIEGGALEIPLETRVQTLEGFDVSVTAFALTTDPTVAVRYEIALVNPTFVNAVDTAIGTSYQDAKVVTAAETGDARVLSVEVPKPLVAGTGLLISYKLPDGDIFETGEKDFVY
jgi:hypothetical protein